MNTEERWLAQLLTATGWALFEKECDAAFGVLAQLFHADVKSLAASLAVLGGG